MIALKWNLLRNRYFLCNSSVVAIIEMTKQLQLFFHIFIVSANDASSNFAIFKLIYFHMECFSLRVRLF